jgi:hypothetical protein
MNWIDVLDRLPEPGVEVLVFASISGVYKFGRAHIYSYRDISSPSDVGMGWSGRNLFDDETFHEAVDDRLALLVTTNRVTHWTLVVGPNGEARA